MPRDPVPPAGPAEPRRALPQAFGHYDVAPGRVSRKQEQRIARQIGGRRRPGSGNQASRPGDVESSRALPDRFLIEAKWTAAERITLRLGDLHKITREAEAEGKVPGFLLEFRVQGVAHDGEVWVAFPWAVAQKWLKGRVR